MCHTPSWASQMKRLREDKSISQEDMAKFVGVHVQTYRQWEQGKSKPKRLQDRGKIAWKLGKITWSNDDPEVV